MKKLLILTTISIFISISISSQLIIGSFLLAKHLHNKTQEDTAIYNENKNLIELQPSEFIFSRVGLSYERMLSPIISIKVPVSIGVSSTSGNNYGINNYIKNYIGVQCLFFPLGHKMTSYIAGISVKGGFVENYAYRNYLGPYGYIVTEGYMEYKKFILPEILNGFRINLGQHFSLTSMIGIGMLKKDDPYGVETKITAQFGMGIKF